MELGYCTTSQVVSDLCMKSCDLCSPADKESTIQTEEECPAGVLSTCAGIISEHGCNTEDEDTKVTDIFYCVVRVLKVGDKSIRTIFDM